MSTTLKSSATDDIIESLVCPPPPSEGALNEEAISSLIAPPAPEWSKYRKVFPVTFERKLDKRKFYSFESLIELFPLIGKHRPRNVIDWSRLFDLLGKERPSKGADGSAGELSAEIVIPRRVVGPTSKEPRGRGGGTGVIIGDQPPLDVDALLRTKSGVKAVDSPTDLDSLTSSGSNQQHALQVTPTKQLSEAEKLRKVLCELVDTENTYVRHLGYLIKTYLEPLKEEEEALLTSAEMDSLFGNIQEIYRFQQRFLGALEEALEAEPRLHQLHSQAQFKVRIDFMLWLVIFVKKVSYAIFPL